MPASQLPVDLSDLDPFSPSSSRQPSPHPHGALFPTAPAPASRPAPAPPAPVQAAAQSVPSKGVQAGADPLGDLFGTLSIGTPASSSSSRSGSSAPTPATRAVQAQEERSTRILRDLDRGPFAPASPPPAAPFSDEPAGLPSSPSSSSSNAVPIQSLHRRPSRSGTHGFSPPRRLSSLMDLSAASLSHAPSSPPAETSAFSDPFHAASGGAGAERDAWRRIREASACASAGTERIEQALLDEGETSGDWGDFQVAGAGSPLRTEPPALPAAPSKPLPVPSRPSAAPAQHAGGRAASLPAAAVAGASSLSSGFSSFFAHPPSSYERRKPSPARAATSAGGGGAFDPTAQPIKLVGLRPGVQRVLEEDVAEGIRPSLPPRLRLSPRWSLLYSLDQHGISLTTLFANLDRGLRDRDGGFVLVVKSERGEVFGAYVSEALRDGAREQRGSTRWGGDGSCFLWKSTPFPPTDFRIGSSVQSFKPTFRNTFYVYATSSSSSSTLFPSSSGPPGGESFLAFGGGEDGVFGLYVDGVFERGWTGRCETYGNEPLVGAGGRAEGQEGKFEVVGLECWAVGS
ncbi:oxidation resistance protein 1 [Rhodotorula kratochvilovae]